MPEDALLTGPLEPTNERYAIAKIAGPQDSARPIAGSTAATRSRAMPTNLYGPGDNFDLDQLARAAGADPQGRTRRVDGGAGARWRSGARARRGASSCTSTIWPMPASYLMEHPRRRRAAHQRRPGRGHLDRRARGAGGRRRRASQGRLRLRHHQARRHAAQAAARHVAPYRPRLAAGIRLERRACGMSVAWYRAYRKA